MYGPFGSIINGSRTRPDPPAPPTPDLSTVLAAGNTSGPNAIVMDNGSDISLGAGSDIVGTSGNTQVTAAEVLQARGGTGILLDAGAGEVRAESTLALIAAARLGTVVVDTTIPADDWDPGGVWPAASVLRTGPAASTATGGLDATGVAAGQLVLLVNANPSNTVTLEHEEGTSAAQNRFICPGGVDFVLGTLSSVFLYYDGANSRWRVVANA